MDRFIKLIAILGTVICVTPVLSRAYMMGKFADAFASGFNGNANLPYTAGDYICMFFGVVVIFTSIAMFFKNSPVNLNNKQVESRST
jgi:hypothetical protein